MIKKVENWITKTAFMFMQFGHEDICVEMSDYDRDEVRYYGIPDEYNGPDVDVYYESPKYQTKVI